MKVTITFETGTAAWVDEGFGWQLRHVLEQVEGKVMRQLTREPGCVCDAPEADDKVIDSNGNTIGSVKVEDEHGPRE